MAFELTTTEIKAPLPKQIELLNEGGYVEINSKGKAIIDSYNVNIEEVNNEI